MTDVQSSRSVLDLSRGERRRQRRDGAQDGRAAARRLSVYGGAPWTARQGDEQAALDAAVSARIDRWASEALTPRVSIETHSRLSAPELASSEKAPPGAGMAAVRSERRRTAAQATRSKAEQDRVRGLAVAVAELDILTERAAADIFALEAHHSLRFALYTLGFLRAYSRWSSRHAPEPRWLQVVTAPGSTRLDQTVLAAGSGGTDA